MRWLQRIVADPNNLGIILDAVDHFQREYEEGKQILQVKGQKIEVKLTRIASEIEYYYSRYQEIEMILAFMDKRVDREVVTQTQNYMDHYNRKITEQTAKKYAEVHDDVLILTDTRVVVAMVRNDFMALFKGLETLSFKLKDIVELRKAMLDDAIFI
jgi:hypothetical protein